MRRGRPAGGSLRDGQVQRESGRRLGADANTRAAAAHADAGAGAHTADARDDAAAATHAVTAAAPCGAAAADLPLAPAPHAAFTDAGNGVNARIRAHLSSRYVHESGHCYFVRGAPATCKYNYPGRGVANGTICEAHSLHWERADVQADMLGRIALAAPGDVVEVQPHGAAAADELAKAPDVPANGNDNIGMQSAQKAQRVNTVTGACNAPRARPQTRGAAPARNRA